MYPEYKVPMPVNYSYLIDGLYCSREMEEFWIERRGLKIYSCPPSYVSCLRKAINIFISGQNGSSLNAFCSVFWPKSTDSRRELVDIFPHAVLLRTLSCDKCSRHFPPFSPILDLRNPRMTFGRPPNHLLFCFQMTPKTTSSPNYLAKRRCSTFDCQGGTHGGGSYVRSNQDSIIRYS